MNQKVKLAIIFGVEFVAVIVILLLVFFAGKKTHKVVFDLNGGTLLSGDLEQEVVRGGNATPPTVAKDGHYLHSWSGTYRQVTKDVVVRAVWEYETTIGIDYESTEDSNYCVISGCFSELRGDVYIGAYHDGKKVLGIKDGAFKDCKGIENVYMLDGIVSIGAEAFSGCTSLKSIDLPSTTSVIGDNAFFGCESLEEITLPEGIERLGGGAFYNCTALSEVYLPASVTDIGKNAFGADNMAGNELTVYTPLARNEIPDGWVDGWFNTGVQIETEYVPPIDDGEESESAPDNEAA